MHFTRLHLLLGALVLAGIGNVLWYWVAGWGLVTVHAYRQPLAKVAASIARQGHIELRTNLDPATPVTLDFDRVPVADAVDRLSIVTDGRWRVAYLVGPDKHAFQPLLDGWAAGKPDPAWRWIDRPLRGLPGTDLGGDEDAAADPRSGKIALNNAGFPTPPPPPAPADPNAPPAPDAAAAAAPPAPPSAPEPLVQLQPLLEKAALFADVQAAVPADWNPPIASFSAKAEAPGLFAKLAGAAHGSSREVFLLAAPVRRGPRPDTADDNPQPFRNRMNPEAMNQALQAYVDRLPPDRRAAAQVQLDDRRKQWEEMRRLTPEQRRARFLAMMNDPAMQEEMLDRQLDREAKMTQQQKDSRASRYVAAKAGAIGK